MACTIGLRVEYAASGNALYYCERVPGTGWQQRALGGTAHVWAWPAIAYCDIAGNLYYVEDPPAVPEPATLALVALGAAGTLAARCRKRRAD